MAASKGISTGRQMCVRDVLKLHPGGFGYVRYRPRRDEGARGGKVYIARILKDAGDDFEEFLANTVYLVPNQTDEKMDFPLEDFQEIVAWVQDRARPLPGYLSPERGIHKTHSTKRLKWLDENFGDDIYVEFDPAWDDEKIIAMRGPRSWKIRYGSPLDKCSFVKLREWKAELIKRNLYQADENE